MLLFVRCGGVGVRKDRDGMGHGGVGVRNRRLTVTMTGNSAFGRGKRMGRRVVGTWEMEKIGMGMEAVVGKPGEEDAGREAVAAGSIGVVTLLVLIQPLLHVQLEAPLAGLVGLVMSVWAVDTLGFNGMGQRKITAMMEDRSRIAVHEAGHFLVGYLLGLRVESYSLDMAPETGVRTGVVFEETANMSVASLERNARAIGATIMGGIAAECLQLGGAKGGRGDLAELQQMLNRLRPNANSSEKQNETRLFAMHAHSLLSSHSEAHKKLAEAMANGRPVAECQDLIDELVDPFSLEESEEVMAAMR